MEKVMHSIPTIIRMRAIGKMANVMALEKKSWVLTTITKATGSLIRGMVRDD